MRLTGNGLAAHKRIATKAGQTGAHGVVTNHATFGVGTARARTRITALAVDAGHLRSALGTGHTLGSALGRYAQVARHARTNRHVVHLAAQTVGAAGRRCARRLRHDRYGRYGWN